MGFSVIEIPDATSQAQYDGKQGTDDSSRVWSIVSDAGPVTVEQVRAFSANIARIGDPHPFNPAKKCTDVDCKHHNSSPIAFDYTAKYSVPTIAGGKPQNPLQQAAKVTYDWAITEEPIDVDADGKPIVMKTGESFDPPIRRPFGDLVVTVERNVPKFDAKKMGDLLFCVNADTWLGLPPGAALLTKLQATQTIQSDGSSYFTKTSSVQYRKVRGDTPQEKAWWWRQIAAGYMWRLSQGLQTALLHQHTTTGVDGFFDVFLSDGAKSSKPLLHDPETGYPWTYGGLVDYSPTRAKPYYFKIYDSKPFSNAQIF